MIAAVFAIMASIIFPSAHQDLSVEKSTSFVETTFTDETYLVNDIQSEVAPVISFDRMEYDFGSIAFKGHPKTVKFRFVNTGNAPLVITRTTLSCTCLSVEYPRKPIMPNGEGFLTITYTPKKETGKFNNTVKVFSNSAEHNPAILFLRVEVTK